MKTFLQRYFKTNFFIKLFFGILFFSIFLYFFVASNQKIIDYKKTTLNINDISVQAWIADDSRKQRNGLSVIDKLEKKEAMIFVFERDDFHPFWMRDMKFDIDIVWLNRKKEAIFIKQHASTKDYPELYTPDKKSKYVVEFVDDFVGNNDIKVGDVFEFDL